MKLSEFIRQTKFWILISVIITIINLVLFVVLVTRLESMAFNFSQGVENFYRNARTETFQLKFLQKRLELSTEQLPDSSKEYFYSTKDEYYFNTSDEWFFDTKEEK